MDPGIKVTLAVFGVLLLLIAAVVVVIAILTGAPAPVDPTQVAHNFGQQQTVMPTRNHVPDGTAVQYSTSPPSSGPHYGTPAAWGFSSTTLDERTWVHNLEHGGIAVLYNCPQGCPADVAAIETFIATAPKETKFNEVKMVGSADPNMTPKFCLVAWGWLLPMDTFDKANALKFYQSHVDQGPEDIP
ncbi:MAG: DUF3105 domain-containing protein [Candidatus Dormibacteria bacterium]